MVYQCLLEKKRELFQQSTVLLWGYYDVALHLYEQLQKLNIKLDGFVCLGKSKKTVQKEFSAVEIYSEDEFLTQNLYSGKIMILPAFSPMMYHYEGEIQTLKDKVSSIPDVQVLSTSELLGEMKFSLLLQEMNLSLEEGEGKLQQFYDVLTDDLSKNILKARISYEFSPHHTHFSSLFQQNKPELLAEHSRALGAQEFSYGKDVPVIFYGVGQYTYQSVAEHHINLLYPELLKKERIYCDRQASSGKNEYCGYPLISPDTLVTAYKDSPVVIATYEYEKEVRQFLMEHGFSSEQLFSICRTEDKMQYFEEEIITLGDHEIFLDVGVFDAGTSIAFAQKCDYDKIYLFEPHQEYFATSKENLEEQKVRNYEMFPFGLWHEETVLKFGGVGVSFGVDRHTATEDCLCLPVKPLDSVLPDVPVTFIKMDVEGSEYPSLVGASGIIQKYKPKLAISIYHKPEDLLQLQQYIQSLVPEYRFFLRQYQTDYSETVLYAVI